MALGGPVVRQHYVEFIRGTGVKLDGVVDGTSTNGPWTWVVPKDVSVIFVTGVGAGGGGGSSTSATPSSRGGGGGGSGVGVVNIKCAVFPGASLTVTVGAKGAAATAGGGSTITNLVFSPFDNTTTLDLKGGTGGVSGTAAGGGVGLAGYNIGVGGVAPSNAATPGVAVNVGLGYFPQIPPNIVGYVIGSSGATCGGASTNGATAGNSGGVNPATMWLHSGFMQTPTASTGDQTGTQSRSGGGLGGPSIIGYGGNGGNAATNGSNATGYGAAGGGAGGGGATGGSGSDGYIGIFYWSAD